jgi:CheY-like chemotaxis protein
MNVKKLFIIDDDPIYHYMIKKIANSIECDNEIKYFLNGWEAIRHIENIQIKEDVPEIIFLDINMPIMDGWSFLKNYSRIQNINPNATFIYLVSSSKNPLDILKAKEFCQISGFITKPLQKDQLIYVLEHKPKNLWPSMQSS